MTIVHGRCPMWVLRSLALLLAVGHALGGKTLRLSDVLEPLRELMHETDRVPHIRSKVECVLMLWGVGVLGRWLRGVWGPMLQLLRRALAWAKAHAGVTPPSEYPFFNFIPAVRAWGERWCDLFLADPGAGVCPGAMGRWGVVMGLGKIPCLLHLVLLP
jgi:hypothetical protein